MTEPEIHRKQRADAPAGFFSAEAAGLRWLAEAEAAGGPRIARVRAVADRGIELERVPPGRAASAIAERLGRALAVMHQRGAEGFGGGPPDGPGRAWIGRQTLPLGHFRAWGEFYAESRVRPYCRAARDMGNLSAAGAQAVDRVCARLAAGEFNDGRPAARIHGDLWSGNVLWSTDQAVLIDPAAHGGHGETDLAMLDLFGLPFLGTVQAAYAEAAELDQDWRSRIALHQLHPVLVHAVSHGPEYGAEAERLAEHYA